MNILEFKKPPFMDDLPRFECREIEGFSWIFLKKIDCLINILPRYPLVYTGIFMKIEDYVGD